MTQQEIFDKILTHLDQQGHPALDDHKFTCVYQSLNGDKCAIGCLLEDYRPEMDEESWGIVSLMSQGYLLVPDVGTNIDLLRAMQRLHDNAQCQSAWSCIPNRARSIARQFRLDTNVLDSLSLKWKE